MTLVRPVNNKDEGFRKEEVRICEAGGSESAETSIIIEEPLSIRIEGSPYALVMRSPGAEKAHVAGFCLSEGIIDGPEDLSDIGFCTEEGVNVATVNLTAERKERVSSILARKGYISQTSCGICGKEMASDICQILSPVETARTLSCREAAACIAMLPEQQLLHRETRSAHAALLLDEDLQPVSFSEDVGRHNALDKAIGKALLENRLPSSSVTVMSSRLSYELVQKAARAGLAFLFGISRPTALAVDLAREIGMTLACSKGERLMIFSGKGRIIT
jgi:FdhD protein